MPDPFFRLASRDDIRTILALSDGGAVDGHTSEAGDWADAAYAEAFEAIEADPAQEIYVVEIEGEVIGCVQISILPGLPRRGMKRGLLENVHVRQDSRGKGIGAAMIAFAIVRCRERGCGVIQLTSNKKRVDAHRFYRRLGFEQSHEGFKLFL
jgi:GNAT superfamily N-acetyltransferase